MSRLPFALCLLALACKDSTPVDSNPIVVDLDGDGYEGDEDCDEDDASINAGAAEVCDGVDNDCDGLIDDADDSVDGSTGVESWADADGDSYGDAASATWSCVVPEGNVSDSTDCDDGDADTNPGAAEVCDGVDNDCDALVDDNDDSLDAATGVQSFADSDSDGYGDAEAPTWSCVVPSGHVQDSSDCDDSLASVYPGASEICDGLDNNCNGQLDEGLLGTEQACAAASCAAILALDSSAADGAWYIDHDGDSGTPGVALQCNMTAGGWTLGLLINTINQGVYFGDFGGSELSLGALALDPAESSSTLSTTEAQGWLDLNDASYSELVLAAYADGAETYMSDPIAASELRVRFGEPGYLLYNDSNGYYWCGGDASYTDAGVGQVNQPSGAPSDCKNHSSLGSGWDFSASTTANQGLTLCGGDASTWMYGAWASSLVYYPNAGAAQAIWIR